MAKALTSAIRERSRPLKVYVSPDERAAIERAAASTGLSVSDYLRRVGKGYQPPSIYDQDAIRDLMRVTGDQGRLGGLLKLWLVDRAGEGAAVEDVRALLSRLEEVTELVAQKAGVL